MLLQSLTWYAIDLFARIRYYIMQAYDLGFLSTNLSRGVKGYL